MIVILLIILLASPVYAAPGVAVVQSAAPTSNGGTQDFTSSGFGTPVCAMFFVSYGTVNGTVVDHAMYAVGFSDFTNEQSLAHADEDTASTTDTGSSTGTTALRTLLNTDQTVDGTAAASTITDGVRLTWADAPPSAYLVTAVMFNATAVSNCTVGTITGNATVDLTASVSGLGWQPQVVIGASRNNITSTARTSIGFAVDNGGTTQYAIGQNSQDGAATSDLVQVIRNDRIVLNPLSTGAASLELTSWDSGGFTLTTRDTGSTTAMLYLAMRLQAGVSAAIIACNSPTSTGAKSCTGTGWTPQAGIFLQTIADTLTTYSTSGTTNESYGLSAFTASQSSTSSISMDDGVATANTTSMTDSKVARLRKDGGDFITATLSGFQSNGVNLNYSVTDSTARLGAMLLFKSTSQRRRGAIWFQ